MRSALLLPALIGSLCITTAVYGGANPHFTLPMHGIYPATFAETCDTPAQAGVNCVGPGGYPLVNLPAGAVGAAVLYLFCYNHSELKGVQTAFEFTPWTIVFGNWSCQSNQLSLATPADPGGPDAGLLSTAFDCVESMDLQVIGFMTMLVYGSGCIRQINPAGSTIQALDCSLEIDEIDVTIPPYDARVGRVCIGTGGLNACEPLTTPVDPATWGGIKAQYK